MEFNEFIKIVKKGIEVSKEFPNDGVGYLLLNDDTEMMFESFMMENLGVKEIALYIVGLSKCCKKAFMVSPTYKESMVSPHVDSVENAPNKYFSFYSFDFTMVPDEGVVEQKELFDYTKINVEERVYTYNSKSNIIMHSPLLTEIHTDILKCSIAQDLIFMRHWKKYLVKIQENKVDNIHVSKPFGENKLMNSFTPRNIVENHFTDYFNNLYNLVFKQIKGIKSKIKNEEDFGTFNMQDIKDIVDNPERYNNTNNSNNTNNKNKNEYTQENNEGARSLKDRIRERLGGK